jgi:ribosomal protein L7Ae-like RNA K-turn-binding protein
MPSLDAMTRMMLQHMDNKLELRTGLHRSTSLIIGASMKPLIVVITADACSPVVARLLDQLRVLAAMRGIPVVHALTRQDLGRACRSGYPVTAVCVLDASSPVAIQLMKAVLTKVADAYTAWVERTSSCYAASQANFSGAAALDGLTLASLPAALDGLTL